MRLNVLLILLFFSFTSVQVNGQAPTGHAEVWKNVQTYWELWSKRDLDNYLNYYNDDYSGWSYEDAMHRNKSATKKWLTQDFDSKEVLVYDISVIDINIHEDVSFVHYYYSVLERRKKDGDEIKSKGRKTDILKWQDDKWMIIGSHGGPEKRDK